MVALPIGVAGVRVRVDAGPPVRLPVELLLVDDRARRRRDGDIVGEDAHAQLAAPGRLRELGLQPHREEHDRQPIRESPHDRLGSLGEDRGQVVERGGAQTAVEVARALGLGGRVVALSAEPRDALPVARTPGSGDLVVEAAEPRLGREGAGQRRVAGRAPGGQVVGVGHRVGPSWWA